ncbi:PTS sugar transporter subunit IIC [Enterococcus songbeiensis]|uniref:PTS sugar transporter subunit IIC n=1 Tax=Enterococcus songbeiensis TaxID=2559927 RepID=UPI0010F6FBCE|nr:PTS transporter subunit EIIC [Enterococcus songbeiensis]
MKKDGKVAGNNSNFDKDKFVDKLVYFAQVFSQQLYMRTLRDSFVLIMPIFTVAGIAIMINQVIFPFFASGDTLAKLQIWGQLVTNGTLNIGGLAVAVSIGFILARNRDFNDPLAASIVSLAGFIISMPLINQIIPTGATDPVDITGVVVIKNLGANGMFSAIIIGLISVEIFIKLSNIKKLQIHMGDSVPPFVAKSFNSLIPFTISISAIALIGALLLIFFETDITSLIIKLVQEPLQKINTNLFGVLLIYGIGNLFFWVGIHPFVNSTILNPPMLVNMSENMDAFAAGQEPPHILTNTFRDTFGQFGGVGNTIGLIIAILLFSKIVSSRKIAWLSLGPGLFNINEPMIFGYPIVFNLPMLIPFYLNPLISLTIAYFFTSIGWMAKTVVMVPWNLPPVVSAYLATAGDWRAAVIHFLILVLNVLLYLPFLKLNEKIMKRTEELNGQVS